MMAVRTVNGCSIIRSSSSLCCFHQFKPLYFGTRSKLGVFPSNYRFDLNFNVTAGKFGFSAAHSFVDSVLEELQERRRMRAVAASKKLEFISSKELLKVKYEKQGLRGGLLLEFKKDAERVLLAVVQKPDGKRNWMVSDQNGTLCSIKPQQITYVVPGVENFDHTQIPNFLQRAQDNLDSSLLELAWAELLEKDKSVTPEELAEMIFGTAEPLESYCAHLLLSKGDVYFSMQESKGYRSVYTPRPSNQVEELLKSRHARETAERQLQEFIQLLYSARAKAFDAKPSKSSWTLEEKTRDRIEALVSFAVDECCTSSQKKTAESILTSMGLARTTSSALNLLIDIGYFPVHVNVDLLKLNIRTDHSENVVSAAEYLLSEFRDTDEIRRKDLTHMKVYAIDVDEADELDDALSASRLPDGRIKVWIHVADPTCLVQPGSILDKEAMSRGTTVFLPTATYPMFPEKLAMEGMSLKQGTKCRAVTVAVVLHSDGR